MSGWNKPSAANQPAVKKGGTKAPSMMKGVIVGAVAVVVGVVCIFAFSGKSEKPAEKGEKSGGRIKEVTPHLTTNNVSTGDAMSREAKELPPQKVGEIRNGYRLLGNGKLHKVEGVITNSLAHRKASTSIFKHRSENILAGLLAHRPGDILVGMPNYNGKFTEDFFASLQDQIVIESDDSEEHKELKRLVIEAKKTLKEAMDRGEDVEKIVMDARKECQELAQYKQALTKDVVDCLRKEDVTDEDVDLFVEAANKMLEKKGIAPINAGPLTRLKLKMQKGENE